MASTPGKENVSLEATVLIGKLNRLCVVHHIDPK